MLGFKKTKKTRKTKISPGSTVVKPNLRTTGFKHSDFGGSAEKFLLDVPGVRPRDVHLKISPVISDAHSYLQTTSINENGLDLERHRFVINFGLTAY